MRQIGPAMFLLLLGSLIIASCATTPIVREGTQDQAREALDNAQSLGAATKSPYEFASAQFYYERAMVEQNNGNLVTARKYFGRACDQALKAYENAKKFRKAL